MHTFKDKADRSWDLEATYASYARVKAHTGVSLFDLATEERKSLEQLADPFVLGQVIWCMVEPQAIARKLTPEAFYEAFDGKTLEASYNALIDEMVFFCPTRVQKILSVAVRKVREVDATADRIAEERMPEIEAAIDEARRIRPIRKRRQKLAELFALIERWDDLHELLNSIESAEEVVEAVWWLHLELPGAGTV